MTNSDHSESIESQWKSLKTKYQKLDVLKAKLNRSLLIQKLWPKAFEHGKVHSYFKGGSITYHYRYKEVRFVIENGIGMTKAFELTDVPNLLIRRMVMIQINKATSTELVHAMEAFYAWYRLQLKRKE